MKIALGSDHRGFALKSRLVKSLSEAGHEIMDLGCASADSCDYPDFAFAVGEAVVAGGADRGILVCGSGIGMSIAANKVPGVRAARVDPMDALRAEAMRREKEQRGGGQ